MPSSCTERMFATHAKLVHDELGMKYIRFHGIFDDDMLCFQRLSDYKPFAAVPFSDKIDEINFKQIADVFDNVLAWRNETVC